MTYINRYRHNGKEWSENANIQYRRELHFRLVFNLLALFLM